MRKFLALLAALAFAAASVGLFIWLVRLMT